MKNSIEITVEQLKEMLLNWNGATMVSFQYATTPKLTKEGKAKFGKVSKLANITAMVGYKYENSVNNQREREGEMSNFMAQPLWRGAGKRLSTALSTNTNSGKFYMSYKKVYTLRSFHFDEALNLLSNALISQFFPKSNPSKYQGTEKAVYHREISLENIKKLKTGGQSYVIV